MPNFVEPFAGSLAILLRRPGWDEDAGQWRDGHNRVETINDLDGLLTNFWRAVQGAPDAVAEAADNPVHELDLHARHLAINKALLSTDGLDADALDYAASKSVLPFAARLTMSPRWFDAEIAGWWCWGVCSWIGDNFARPKCLARPHLGAGQGVHRQRPHLGDAGQGVNRQAPSSGGGTCADRRAWLKAWFGKLSDRLRNVRVCCGDWERVCGHSPITANGLCGVLLDPPYSQTAGVDTVYTEHDPDVSARVRAWCLERGGDPLLRVALCGYEHEGHEALEEAGWSVLHWRANGGYANYGAAGNENARRERIWFSPHCVAANQGELW